MSSHFKIGKISLGILALVFSSTQIQAAPTSSATAPNAPGANSASMNAKTSSASPTNILTQFGAVRITFDYYIWNVGPMAVYGSNPSSWIAPVPQCPPGTTQVPGPGGGVPASQPVYDYGPGFPYYDCFCNGNCGAAAGNTLPLVTHIGAANSTLYGAKVVCTFTSQGSFPKTFFDNNVGVPDYPSPGYHYTYCQRGNAGCPANNPVPANLLGGITIPTNAWSPITRMVFKACGTGAGLPDTTK